MYKIVVWLFLLQLVGAPSNITSRSVQAAIQHYWDWRALWEPEKDVFRKRPDLQTTKVAAFWANPVIGYCSGDLRTCEALVRRSNGSIVALHKTNIDRARSVEENVRAFISQLPLWGVLNELTEEEAGTLLVVRSSAFAPNDPKAPPGN